MLKEINEQAEIAEKMIVKLRAGMMPPPGQERPSAETLLALVETLEAVVDAAAEEARCRGTAGEACELAIQATGVECQTCIKKAYDYFKTKNYNIVQHYTDFWNDIKFHSAKSIGDDIVDRYRKKEIDSIRFIYNEFKSVASQIIKSEKLFPLEHYEENKEPVVNKVFMPSKNEIIKTLIPKYINVQIWQYFLESNASEQAARMLAMENATENAGEMISDLSLEYNKARQAAITT